MTIGGSVVPFIKGNENDWPPEDAMLIPLIVFAAALVMIGCEFARPGRSWPHVAGWWLRAALLNGIQVGMVFLAGVA
jgi:hypothetical protein